MPSLASTPVNNSQYMAALLYIPFVPVMPDSSSAIMVPWMSYCISALSLDNTLRSKEMTYRQRSNQTNNVARHENSQRDKCLDKQQLEACPYMTP